MANPTGKPHNSKLSISIHRTRQVFSIQKCRQNPQHAANERFIHPSLSISLSIGTSDACLLIALSPDIKELSTRSFLICSQIHSLYVTWLHKEQSGHLKPIIVQFLTLKKKGYNQEPILMQTEESTQPAFTFFHMHNNNFVVHTKQINARQETTGAIQEHSIVTILHLWSRKVVNMAINLIARSHTQTNLLLSTTREQLAIQCNQRPIMADNFVTLYQSWVQGKELGKKTWEMFMFLTLYINNL